MEIEAIIQRHAVHAAEHPCWQSMHIASPRHTGGCWYLRLEYRRSPLFALFPLEVLGNAVRDETGMDVVQAQWIALEHGVGAVWFWKAPRKEEAG